MKESTEEILRQLELELLRLDDFHWRLSRLSSEEAREVAAALVPLAESLSLKAHALASAVSLPPQAVHPAVVAKLRAVS